MVPTLLALSALIPACLLLWYLCRFDANPEPPAVVIKVFLLGGLVTGPIVPVAMFLESLGARALGAWEHAAVSAFLGAAIPEETFKFLVLRFWVWRQKEFDEPMDGIVYGAAASLGFAALENILYVSGNGGGFSTALLRALTAVPSHALTGVVMGYFVGRARFAPEGERGDLLGTGLLAAIALHGAYDLFLIRGQGFSILALAVLALEIWWCRRLIGQMHREQLALAPPVAALLPAHSEVVVVAAGERHRTRWAVAKLLLGGLGASLCGLLLAGCALAKFSPSEEVPLAGLIVVGGGALGLTIAFLRLFASGLRGPFAARSDLQSS